MTSNRKKIAILIITVALLLIIVIIYLALRQRHVPAASSVTLPSVATSSQSSLPYSLPISSNSSQTASTGTTLATDYPTPPPTHQLTANDLGKIAMAFSERIGSFSNQSGYTNINDLEIMMTDSMKTWADTYINKLETQYQNNGAFYSVTTHALLFKVNSFDDLAGMAKITVTTQRSVQDGSLKIQAKPYNQNISVTFKKVDGKWLVDGAYWQK